MTTWVRDQFRDSEHAQRLFLRVAVGLGVVAFLVVVGASWLAR